VRLVAFLLLLLPAPALADPYIDTWLERCFLEADRQAIAVASGDSSFGSGTLLPSMCGYQGVEICRFGEAPLSCLERSLSLISAEIEARVERLPKNVDDLNLRPDSYHRDLTRLKREETESEVKALRKSYTDNFGTARPLWMPDDTFFEFWKLLSKLNSVSMLEARVMRTKAEKP
jgi:hypothetical protein